MPNIDNVKLNGTVYDLIDSALRSDVEDFRDEFLDYQEHSLQAIPLKGSIYMLSGSYIGGVKEQGGSYSHSCHYLVKGMKKLHIVVTTSQWYDIYDFIDDNDSVISYRQEDSPSRTLTFDIDVPDNALYMVISGSGGETATVVGYDYSFDEFNSLSVVPSRYVRGFVHQNGNLTQNETSYRSYIYDVHAYKYITITSKAFEFSLAYSLFDEIGGYVPGVFGNPSMMYQKENGYQVTIQNNGSYYLYVSVTNDVTPVINGYTGQINQDTFENDSFKNIIWYGTSIPAGGYIGEGNTNAYPARVGRILRANVINKAVGSSSISCKDPERVSETNPYGFVHDFELCSRCLSNTIEEMQWIINHFDDRTVFDYRTVDTLTEQQRQDILSFSYENRLIPYLDGTNQEPDLFVFDHGFNDGVGEDSNYDKQILIENGVKELGWYHNGVHQSGTSYQSIRFNCSNYDYIMLNATIGIWYDVYDLFDGNGNYLRSMNGTYAVKEFTNLEIDVRDASSIVVSCGSESRCDLVRIYGLPYGDPDHNRFSFRGSYGYILNLLFSYNPRARVMLVGNYCNDGKYEYIANAQNWIADHWDIPIYKQWENYGWTDKIITTKWRWLDGKWIKGAVNHDISIRDCWLADGVHPHSDVSGTSLQFMANHIASFIYGNVWSQFKINNV